MHNERPEEIPDGIVVTVEDVKKSQGELDVTKINGAKPNLTIPAVGGCKSTITHCLKVSIKRLRYEVPRYLEKGKRCLFIEKGYRMEALDYRLVPLTSVPCKVLEKVVRSRTVERFERIEFVTKNQHGLGMESRIKHSRLSFITRLPK